MSGQSPLTNVCFLWAKCVRDGEQQGTARYPAIVYSSACKTLSELRNIVPGVLTPEQGSITEVAVGVVRCINASFPRWTSWVRAPSPAPNRASRCDLLME